MIEGRWIINTVPGVARVGVGSRVDDCPSSFDIAAQEL